jgi:hypothetical protein
MALSVQACGRWSTWGQRMDRFVESQVKLGPGERYIDYWRESILVLIWRLTAPAVAAMALVLAFAYAAGLSPSVRGFVFGIIIVVGIAITVWISDVLLEWYVRIFVLTNRRVIRREGLIRQSRMEAQLVGLGRVIAETASMGPDLTIGYVKGAPAIASEILSAAEAAKLEISRVDEERARQLLSQRIVTRM